jgi:hypothetical protein
MRNTHCCQATAGEVPPLAISPQVLGGLLFARGPATWRTAAALRAMPAGMLAPAAQAWGDQHGSQALVELLEPLFRSPAGLHAQYEDAFELLQGALLASGQDAARERAARILAEQATDRSLRCSGRCRLAAMAADRGEDAAAWQEFKQAQRESPDDPQVLHLELTMLLAAGRDVEARGRAPVLAARARRLGHPELGDILLRLGEGGLEALYDGPVGTEPIDDEVEAWLTLLRAPLPLLDAGRFAQLHDITCSGEGTAATLRVLPVRRLQSPLKTWRARYAPSQPILTETWSAADALLEEPEAARDWLRKHPDCALALPVLDDLLVASRDMVNESAEPVVLAAAANLAFAAAAMVVAALAPWPRATLRWAVPANRPLLRILAQAIELALERYDPVRAEGWMRWMLARNPDDNHGWRELLRQALLRRGDAPGALALLDAYPRDAAPAGHDRALALFLLGRREEAEAMLRAAHAELPGLVASLLPDTLDRPDTGTAAFVEIGSAAAAWDWRSQVRDGWVRSGALDWLRALALPQPVAKRKRTTKPRKSLGRTAAAGKPATVGSAAFPLDFSAKDLAVLKRNYALRLPWLLGWLAANAWAPDLVMPALWAGGAVEHASGRDDPRSMQALLEAVMNTYNAFNAQRLAAAADALVPLPAALDAGDDAAWAGFAAGFVQGLSNTTKAPPRPHRRAPARRPALRSSAPASSAPCP